MAVLALAYLAGAFPTGYLVARALAGVDVRRVGSGRTGGTNVLRSVGPLAAIVTVLGDGLKGVLAVSLARAMVGSPVAVAVAGVAVVLGHNYSVFLGWDGGAGTATSIGAALTVHPLFGSAAMALGAAVLVGFRYASLASIAVLLALAVLFGGAALWGGLPAVYALYTAVAALVCIAELRPNIARLLAGTERKLTWPVARLRSKGGGSA